MNEQRPTVSVCCITYNHERFLAEAIDSVLMQVTDFSVEMVIGEDCSTDGTRAIAQGYERRFPGRVRVLTPSANLGIMPNLMATLNACKGEYIALLEGDDYWTDATKLQRQVDALRANEDCALCFHDAEMFYDSDTTRPTMVFSQQIASHALPLPTAITNSLRFTQLDLARVGWIMPTASILFRAISLPKPLPAWFAGVFSGDYTLHLLSTHWGPALYLPYSMSRYRLHENSITNSTSQSIYQFERRIHEAKMFRQYVFDVEHKKYADIYLANVYSGYGRYLAQQGQRLQSFKYFTKSMLTSPARISLYLARGLQRLLPT